MLTRAIIIFFLIPLLAMEEAKSDPPPADRAVCASEAQTYLIRGDMVSERIGARLWNLDKISHDIGKPGRSGCSQEIWVRAAKDQRNYWEHMSAKWGCNEDLDNRNNVECTPERAAKLRNEFGYLNTVTQRAIAGSTCIVPSSRRSTLNDLSELTLALWKSLRKVAIDIKPVILEKEIADAIEEDASAGDCSHVDEKIRGKPKSDPLAIRNKILKNEQLTPEENEEFVMRTIYGPLYQVSQTALQFNASVPACKTAAAKSMEAWAQSTRDRTLLTVGSVTTEEGRQQIYDRASEMASSAFRFIKSPIQSSVDFASEKVFPFFETAYQQIQDTYGDLECIKDDAKAELVCTAVAEMSADTLLGLVTGGVVTKGGSVLLQTSKLTGAQKDNVLEALNRARKKIGLTTTGRVATAANLARRGLKRVVTPTSALLAQAVPLANSGFLAVKDGSRILVSKAGKWYEVSNTAAKNALAQSLTQFNRTRDQALVQLREFKQSTQKKISTVAQRQPQIVDAESGGPPRSVINDKTNIVVSTPMSREVARQFEDWHFKRYADEAFKTDKYPHYLPNARESVDYFDNWFHYVDTKNPTKFYSQYTNANNEMHVIASRGKSGNTPYNSENPGVIRSDRRGMISERLGAHNYTVEVAKRLNLGNVSEGKLKIKGIPDSDLPRNSSTGEHIYPAGISQAAYFQRGAELMRNVKMGIENGTPPAEIRKEIGRYYHVMVNARSYDNVNNSLFMNQANYLLRRTGHPGIPQGDWDHLLMRLDSDQAERAWEGIIDGTLPSARELQFDI